MNWNNFSFIDLFAGIGGIRLGFESVGGHCVFSSEFDENACKTYEANFGEHPSGDITKIAAKDIPDFDVLLGGFPCQAFSIIGKKEGFENETCGTLFFEIERILSEKKIEIDMSNYNFYLMPLAYVSSNMVSESVLTEETKNYLTLVKSKIAKEESDQNYDIAITIDIDFKKGSSFDGLGFTYDKDGIKVALTEENIRKRYPWDNAELIRRCKMRYSDFKQNKNWNAQRNEIKNDAKLYRVRLLDPGNPKSAKKGFYSTNVFSYLDSYYTKKS